jgi:hypothetical protein
VTPNSVGAAISAAQQVKIQPGEGISESDLLSQMTEEQADEYISQKEAKKADVMSRSPGYVPPPVSTTNLASTNSSKAASANPRTSVQKVASTSVQVGKVAPTTTKITEGISVGVKTGGGIETWDASGTDSKPVESVVYSDGIMLKNTNGPRKDVPGVKNSESVKQVSYQEDSQSKIDRDGTADARRVIAKAICKDFPDSYDFSDHWKRRLANLRLNFEGRSDVIRAVFAAESDDFKRLILDEFPEAFQA